MCDRTVRAPVRRLEEYVWISALGAFIRSRTVPCAGEDSRTAGQWVRGRQRPFAFPGWKESLPILPWGRPHAGTVRANLWRLPHGNFWPRQQPFWIIRLPGAGDRSTCGRPTVNASLRRHRRPCHAGSAPSAATRKSEAACGLKVRVLSGTRIRRRPARQPIDSPPFRGVMRRRRTTLVIGGKPDERVEPYAKEFNFRYFIPETFDGASSAFRTSCQSKCENGYMRIYMEKYVIELLENCVWITEAMNAGHAIVDIGPDPSKRKKTPAISPGEA